MIADNDVFTIRWQDDAHTVLLCEIKKRWSWESAHDAVKLMNDECGTVPHGVYTVYHYLDNIPLLPKGGSAIANIRQLMAVESPNDELYLFVGRNLFLSQLINIASKTYGLREVVARFRFVNTLEEALTIIDEHKQGKRHRNAEGKSS